MEQAWPAQPAFLSLPSLRHDFLQLSPLLERVIGIEIIATPKVVFHERAVLIAKV
jgi:hypothetical protein